MSEGAVVKVDAKVSCGMTLFRIRVVLTNEGKVRVQL